MIDRYQSTDILCLTGMGYSLCSFSQRLTVFDLGNSRHCALVPGTAEPGRRWLSTTPRWIAEVPIVPVLLVTIEKALVTASHFSSWKRQSMTTVLAVKHPTGKRPKSVTSNIVVFHAVD